MTDTIAASNPPWAKAYPPELDLDFAPVDRSAISIIEDSIARGPEKPCLDFLGSKMTYGEVGDMINHVARGLQDMGVKKCDRIGLCLPNSPYYVACYFAILKIGATVVNFNPLYTADETRHQVEDSDVAILITLDVKMLYDKVIEALDGTNVVVVVCSLADALPTVKSTLYRLFKRAEIAHPHFDKIHIAFEQLCDNAADPAPATINPLKDIAILQYTGGTTGIPKGAMLTHANVASNAKQAVLWIGDVKPGEEKFLCVLPFFHVFAMTVAMNMGLETGSELILLPRFELATVLKVINKKRPTVFPAVPTIYNAINNHPKLSSFDLTSIRYCVSGGAALPVEVKRNFEKLTGCVVVEGYGLSEASPVTHCNPVRGVNKPGSIGLPFPGTNIEIRDLDDFSKTVPLGDRGEVAVRGPQVMAGYWKNPDETAATLVDGWLRTGDVGHMDDEGYTFLTDRLKDVIICSGYKIYPRTVEEALYQHPDVEEAIVIAIADEYRGEAPKAFVKLRPGASAGVDDLMAFANDHLNPLERPAALEIRDALPKTLIGKLSKKELVAEEKQKAGASA